MNTKDLIMADDASIDAIAQHLNQLGHEGRMAECLSLGKKPQSRLFELAAGSPPLTLDDFVAPSVPSMQMVVQHGRNSLPMFRRFQKPMCRFEETGRIGGFNEGATRSIIGPGYFIAEETAGHPDATPEWTERGAVVVNYFKVPDEAVPEGWPTVKPNEKGLQKFVFKGTRDFMRGVSDHVTIGAAFRGEKPMNSYFVLVREDA